VRQADPRLHTQRPALQFEAFGAPLMPIIASVDGEATPTIAEARHFQPS
jgi:hypothetical protein